MTKAGWMNLVSEGVADLPASPSAATAYAVRLRLTLSQQSSESSIRLMRRLRSLTCWRSAWSPSLGSRPMRARRTTSLATLLCLKPPMTLLLL